MKVICIGNYPPRKCGIATFTENLVKSVISASHEHNADLEVEVIAMNDRDQVYDYPNIVKLTIADQVKEEYIIAAEYINNSGADLCVLQHEFGIYGGNSGLLILSLLRQLTIPIVSTFHTVLQKPTFHQKEVLKKIAEYSDQIVIMNPLAISFLTDIYEVPATKIIRIEHGVPDFGTIDTSKIVKPESWQGRKVLLTFGLLGRSKGIETVIKSLPSIVKNHPDILYVVLGKTHPHVVKHAGEEYRQYLEKLTRDLKMENNVEFLNQYVSESELTNYLLNSDIYVTPYLNKAQITSGTLCYAIGGGSAVISTPYWHAEELLTEGRGILFDFKDYLQLADIVNDLLNNPSKMELLKRNAFEYGLTITWPQIGFQYITMFNQVIHSNEHSLKTKTAFEFNIPEFTTLHLERMTDETGIIQHANGVVADYSTGYCLDDNARALLVCLLAQQRFNDKKYERLIYKYLAFIMFVQNDNGSFKNYITYSRSTYEDVGSDDAFGRAVWALGLLVRIAPNDSLFQLGLDLFIKATSHFHEINYARGYANCIFGLYHYINRFPDQEQFVKMLTNMADNLVELFSHNIKNGWAWFEPVITYDNGLLPAALYLVYELTENQKYLDIAEKSRIFLESKCLVNGHLTLIGNKKWWTAHHETSEYAQQPIDAMAMVLLYDCAYRATKNNKFIDMLKTCFSWYYGNNDLNLPLYDSETKGCNDGLEEYGVSRNQGAESMIAYLSSWLTATQYFEKK